MSNRLKHLVFLTSGFPTNEAEDNSLVYFQQYMKALRVMLPRIRITVISFQYPPQPGTYTWHGISVIALGGNNHRHHRRIKIWFRAWQTLNQLHKSDPFDLIHALWLTECSLVGLHYSRRRGIPCLVTAMGTDVLKKNKYLRLINPLLKEIVFVSEFQKNHFQCSKKITDHIIPWGIHQPIQENISDEKSIDILGVGSLISLKNYNTFIRTIAELCKSQPKLRACLIGDGPKRHQLEQLAETLGVSKNINFVGQQSNADVLRTMGRSRVLLHPSTFESQGFVFLEALAHGMHIVSYDVGVAQASNRWYIAQEASDFVSLAGEAMNLAHDDTDIPYPVEGTVMAYSNVYNRLIDEA